MLRMRVLVRTCRVPSAKLLAVFVQPSAPTRSCQGRDEKSTSRVCSGIRLPSLQRRRDRDGQLALGLPAGKAAYEAGIQVPASAEVLFLVGGCLVGTNSFTQKVVINDRFDMLAL